MTETIQQEADEVVEEYLQKESHRLGECGCHSCRIKQQWLISNWFRNQVLTEEMWQEYLNNLGDE